MLLPLQESYAPNQTYQFESVTRAALRYLRLYLLLSTPRSIPLKKGATQVSRGDSHNRWEEIRSEFALLTPCFPSSHTLAWYLLVVSTRNDIGTDQRRKVIEHLTGRRWSVPMYDQKTAEVYGRIGSALRARGLLVDHAPLIEIEVS